MNANNGLTDVAALWPYMWIALRVLFGALLLSPFFIWPVARRMRRRAYGPGGGRKASNAPVADGWLIVDAPDYGDPFEGFADLPPLGHDADLNAGPRIGDGWQSAAPYGGARAS